MWRTNGLRIRIRLVVLSNFHVQSFSIQDTVYFILILKKLKEILSCGDSGYIIFDTVHKEDRQSYFIKILRPFLKWFFQENIIPNFKDKNEGEQSLNEIGFTVVNYEKKRTINFYTIAPK